MATVAPEIIMPNRRLGQSRGRETILECIITAFPHAVNYWEKDGRKISSSVKYRTEAYDEGDHTIVLSLRVHDIEPTDYGEYKCIASNPLGQDQQVMYLYGQYHTMTLPRFNKFLSSQFHIFKLYSFLYPYTTLDEVYIYYCFTIITWKSDCIVFSI